LRNQTVVYRYLKTILPTSFFFLGYKNNWSDALHLCIRAVALIVALSTICETFDCCHISSV